MPVDTKPAPASLTCAPLHSVCSRSLSCRQPITRACVRCGGATPRRCGFARSCFGLVLAVSQQHTCSRRIALACCSCGGAAVALRWRYASLLWLACLLLRLVLAAGRRRRCSHSLQATDRSLVCDATPCCCGFTGSRYGRVLLASQQHGCGPRLLCLAAVASPVRALASCLLGGTLSCSPLLCGGTLPGSRVPQQRQRHSCRCWFDEIHHSTLFNVQLFPSSSYNCVMGGTPHSGSIATCTSIYHRHSLSFLPLSSTGFHFFT